MAVMIGIFGLIAIYDTLVAQLANNPSDWLRVSDVLGALSWQVWVIIALAALCIFVFEGGYRAVENSRQNIPVSRKVVKVSSQFRQELAIKGSTVTIAKALLLLADQLSIGLSDNAFYKLSKEQFGIGYPDAGQLTPKLRLAEVITVDNRPAFQDKVGSLTLTNYPETIYTLTNFGVDVVNYLRSTDDRDQS